MSIVKSIDIERIFQSENNTGEKKDVETFTVYEGFILSNVDIKYWDRPELNLNPINYIPCWYDEDRWRKEKLYFVFDIEDTRKTYAAACNQLLTHLPQELVIQIAEHLGTTKSYFTDGSEYSDKDFPDNFKPKYKLQSIPEKLTKTQLQKLFQLGVLQLGFICYGTINLFTEESYDHVYPNDEPNLLKKKFPTKQDFLRKLEHLKSIIESGNFIK